MREDPIKLRRSEWFWLGAIWLGFGLVDGAQTVLVMRSENMHHAWVKLFVVTVIKWLPGVGNPDDHADQPPVSSRAIPLSGWMAGALVGRGFDRPHVFCVGSGT
jgi:hypothetical protein